MNWRFTPYSCALFLTAGLAVAVAIVVVRRRTAPGALPFVLFTLALAEWALLSGVENAIDAPAAKIVCAKLEYLGVAATQPLWLLFALAYSHQHRWLRWRGIALIFVVPVVTVVMAATNESHRLVWSAIHPSTNVPGASLVYHHGAWFWVFAAYNYALLLVGTIALSRAILRFRHIYRRQVAAILLGLMIPWVSNLAYLAGRGPASGNDPTPFAFTLTCVIFAWGMFRFRLFDLVPVARDAVIDSMHEGVVVLDARNRVVDINPSASWMIGLAGSPPIGHPVEQVLAAWPEVLTQLREARETQTEVRIGPDSGRCLEVRVAPIDGNVGRVPGRFILLRDVTERVLLEQTRDDLTHTMVHDLRNPLASIRSSLDVLGDDGAIDSAVQHEMLDIARANTQRMLALIDSILDVSQLESGQLVLERQPTALRALVAEASQLQGALAAKRKLEIVNAVPSDLPEIDVDARLLARVLQNLLDNAIKFSPDGGTIRVSAAIDGGTQLLLSVSDDGPGIPFDLRERVFQKFVSGDLPGRGFGLGLAFCRLAVEAHGGRIWVENTPGSRGATVMFTLRLGR